MRTLAPSTVRTGALLALLGGYIAILGYGILTATPAATAVADLYFAIVLLAAAAARVAFTGMGERTRQLETVAFVVAGVAVGYAGLAGLSLVPAVASADTVGTLAILLALGLLLYRRDVERRSVE